ncbi:methyltransferase domain-containing protein [Nocardia aurantiaca]|uniref:Methyltransferase domain-containing protein n=1 Tax=Nocardia aurantiaca TaxID=2675850 RepID=A0A6I3KUF5_9NOCA|nr:methyltransferase domain-containing protein [Nocardia aurantiaca]MTE12498.1 methyltransferase domain-containing protein [Nocardia aurantiaca]
MAPSSTRKPSTPRSSSRHVWGRDLVPDSCYLRPPARCWFRRGAGLELLLDAVGPTGHVYGIEISPTMLTEAGRRSRDVIAAGRLELRSAAMDHLPLTDASLDALISANTIYSIGSGFAEMSEARVSEFVRIPPIPGPSPTAASGSALRG